MIQLRGYQEDAISAIEAAARRGVRRQILALPTGCGKTITFCEWLRRRGGRSLIIVHTDELVQQTVETLGRVMPGVQVGVVKAERNEFNARIVVASVQTTQHPARRQALQGFQQVVVDEAHHAVAPSYRALLKHLGAFDEKGPLVLGATATPERGDGVGLDAVFEAITFERGILDMIQAGVLCDLRAVSVRLKADFKQLHTHRGDFVGQEVAQLLKATNAPQLAVNAYLDHAPGRRALLFTHMVETAHEMAQAFTDAGWPAATVSGETPLAERRAILRQFREGTVRIVTNANVLGEGFDEPSLDCVIIARPTRSRVRYKQMIGRGTRRWNEGGKRDCIILDLVGATDRHDLVTANRIFGLPLQQRESITEATARVQAAATAAQLAAIGRERVMAQAVDLFTPKQQQHSWLHGVEHGLFALDFGMFGGLLVIYHFGEGDRWGIVHSTGPFKTG